MSDLEVFRLSALACGVSVKKRLLYQEHKGEQRKPIREVWDWVTDEDEPWNPFTDDSQRWECMRKLLNTGDIRFSEHGVHEFHPQYGGVTRIIDCPAEEFPARALAELEARNAS